MSNHDGEFTQRVVSASQTTKPQTNAFTSVFGMGEAIEDTTTVVRATGRRRKKETSEATPKTNREVRAGSMRHRLLQTLEACGPLNTDGISQALEITLKQACQLAWQMCSEGRVEKSEAGGRNLFSVSRSRGIHGWLERKDERSTSDVASERSKQKSDHKPTANGVRSTFRCALFNDNSLCIETKAGRVELLPADVRELVVFLDRVSRVVRSEVSA